MAEWTLLAPLNPLASAPGVSACVSSPFGGFMLCQERGYRDEAAEHVPDRLGMLLEGREANGYIDGESEGFGKGFTRVDRAVRLQLPLPVLAAPDLPSLAATTLSRATRSVRQGH